MSREMFEFASLGSFCDSASAEGRLNFNASSIHSFVSLRHNNKNKKYSLRFISSHIVFDRLYFVLG